MRRVANVPSYLYRAAIVDRIDDPERAARLMGTDLACRGIHLPANPPVSTLTGVARELWDSAFVSANEYYKDEKVAKVTAWKAVRLFFRPAAPQRLRNFQQLGFRLFRSPAPATLSVDPALPPPNQAPTTMLGTTGDLVELGVLLEFTFIDANAVLQIRKFTREDPPRLLWNHDRRTAFIFPGAEVTQCEAPDLNSAEAQVYELWNQRPPECDRFIDVPHGCRLRLEGNLDTFVYASTKWHDRAPDEDGARLGAQEYIHQVGDGVGAWIGLPRSSGNPEAIVFTGGCMDLNPRGIIH